MQEINHLLKTLNVKSLLEALLSYTPKGYKDLSLLERFETGLCGVLEVHVLEKRNYAKVLKVFVYSKRFCKNLELVFFNYSAFYYNQFKIGESLFIYGKLEQSSFNQAYIINTPKILKEFGGISLLFKKVKNHKKIQENLQSLLSLENLKKEGIKESIAHLLLEIFFPTPHFLKDFETNKTFPSQHLNALKYIEMLFYMKNLERKKLQFNAKIVCPNNSERLKAFIASLPFQLTNDQQNAIKEIQNDLTSPIACKRLIVGDVGCGKTMVILASMVLAYPNKTLLMAPTSILAKQLYNEALKFLPPYFEVELLLGGNHKKNHLFEKITHVVIGTQALLFDKRDLNEFALVITDEQHRFGTKQRYQLEKMASSKGNKPHSLQFSATPIPRTLALAKSAFVKTTMIREIPYPKEIETLVLHKRDFKIVMEKISEEIAKNHQVIVVYPLVNESEKIPYLSLSEGASFWQKRFKKVYTTSGQDKNKEEVIEEFRECGSILLATTLIEVGISLPRLSVMVILAPERLGLATLHQLRGRVSRNGLKGYCFLCTIQEENERLEKFADELDGFKIAELDLEYRKSGDLLQGGEQSGNSFEYIDLAKDESIIAEVKQDFLKNISVSHGTLKH
ncbi:ATP-dependent DNA helicase RecG [Helicobacter pylori]|uniref:ATP-dependent DNA helicase RecG n=1 Tax=Helicobacter pylori (strain SouthAfrica7) TaxID=907239 RepID=E8QUC2_HELPW|nr:ATP-dependent DNA helicase RecG [Helicobacter pylori]ADU85404.1 ATP-dependent DNA helicase RecG [Helicobacter pylori SouthAfrica7]